MTFPDLQSLWSICVLSATCLEILLLSKVVYGLLTKNSGQTKRVGKYIINTIVCFIFSFYAYMDYALWVNAPRGQTEDESFLLLNEEIMSRVTEQFLYALLWIVVLVAFNILYQLRVERIREIKPIIILALVDFLIMLTTITIGAYTAYIDLSGEISRYFY
jgi:hypothetical protein